MTPTGCIDLSGTWVFEEHCDPAYVDTPVTVSQSGCSFSFSGGGLSNASGTVSGTSSVIIAGQSAQGPISCTGEVEIKENAAHEVELDCTPTCDLKVEHL